jgi:hypothetical protein
MTWTLEEQHMVGYLMMAIGAVWFVIIGIWAISEWFGHPTLKDIWAIIPLVMIVSGVGMLAWAIRLA